MSYKATIKILGREYKSTGDSVAECLEGLKPGFCKSKSVLTIEKGEEKKEKILGLIPTSRLFSNSPAVREINIKQIAQLFDF